MWVDIEVVRILTEAYASHHAASTPSSNQRIF
jgi:hypothetical protein